MDKDLIQLYGFTQDSKTLDYMIVMKYAENGCLRKNLQKIVKFIWIRDGNGRSWSVIGRSRSVKDL